MKARVKADAAMQFVRLLNKHLPPSAGYTYEQFHYKYVLRQLHGKDWPVAEGIVGGISGMTYLIAATTNHHGRPSKSKVVAVDSNLIDIYLMDNEEHPVPVEDPACTGPEAWWKADGLDVVRLLTPWVDGFMAFLPRQQQGAQAIDNKE